MALDQFLRQQEQTQPKPAEEGKAEEE